MQRAEQVMFYAIGACRVAVAWMGKRPIGRKNETTNDVTGSVHFRILILPPCGSRTGVHYRGRGRLNSVKILHGLLPGKLC